MGCISGKQLHWTWLDFVMLTGDHIWMIDNQQLDTVFIWIPIWFLGAPTSNIWSPDLLMKLNFVVELIWIKSLLTKLQVSHTKFLLYGMTIKVLVTCQLIQCYIPEPSILN